MFFFLVVFERNGKSNIRPCVITGCYLATRTTATNLPGPVQLVLAHLTALAGLQVVHLLETNLPGRHLKRHQLILAELALFKVTQGSPWPFLRPLSALPVEVNLAV